MKITTSALILVIPMVIGFNSCKKSDIKLSNEDMKDIVYSRNAQLGECFKSGDVERLALMYTDSAKLSPNGSDFVRGRNNIKTFWAEDFKSSKVMEMTTKVLTIDGDNEVIYETGLATSKIIYNDSLYNVIVKYINVWRKQPNGKYLLDIDFWNKAK